MFRSQPAAVEIIIPLPTNAKMNMPIPMSLPMPMSMPMPMSVADTITQAFLHDQAPPPLQNELIERHQSQHQAMMHDPPHKRKRHTRTRTGCQQCRQQRIKCTEGPVDAGGRKVICRRCWETDRECFYPASSSDAKPSRGNQGKLWERAVDVEQWTSELPPGVVLDSPVRSSVPDNGAFEWPVSDEMPTQWQAPTLSQVTGQPRAASQSEMQPPAKRQRRRGTGLGLSGVPGSSSMDSDKPLLGDPNEAVPTTTTTDATNALITSAPHTNDITPKPRRHSLLPSADDFVASPESLGVSRSPEMQVSTTTAAVSQRWQILHTLMNPSPSGLISTFKLASLSESSVDRATVAYFEERGCQEIVSCSAIKQNWIFVELFPRYFSALSGAGPPLTAGSAPGSRGSSKESSDTTVATTSNAMKDWLYLCLLYLAYVHRGNIEQDPRKAWYWRSMAKEYRDKAGMAALRCKAPFSDGVWKCEEYLMGLFVRCMGDMLDSGHVSLDPATVFELPWMQGTTFYPGLRDMLATYSIMSRACTPLDVAVCLTPRLSLPLDGPEWSERFFGLSRRSINLAGYVSRMVADRATLITAGREGSQQGLVLVANAERLVAQLGERAEWDETVQDLGKSDRIQRGSEVLRCALRVMLLCEVLNVPLTDRRIETSRDKALELVADTDPAAFCGFQFALTLIAVYTQDRDDRARLEEMMRVANDMSFGSNYRGSASVLTLCWEVLDARGSYPNGIAPWRDGMAATGRNLWL